MLIMVILWNMMKKMEFLVLNFKKFHYFFYIPINKNLNGNIERLINMYMKYIKKIKTKKKNHLNLFDLDIIFYLKYIARLTI